MKKLLPFYVLWRFGCSELRRVPIWKTLKMIFRISTDGLKLSKPG